MTSCTPLSTDQLIAKYDGRTPRYTSYPTAAQFTPEVTEETYRGWLAELPADDPVSLYVHVPFCARLCWYCGCNTRAVNSRQPIADYVALLLGEAAMLEQALPGPLAASALHFGGGTPNMLNLNELEVIFGVLRHIFRFMPDVEIAAELDPAILTPGWVRDAARLGLNRASLGVQNLSPQVQQAVNRRETFEEIERCMGWLRDAGVGSINLDLMYGLPHQSVENTLSTIDAVLRLAPERIALFGYAHVPWMKSHQKLIHEAALPGPSERLDQSEAAAERLDSAGYVRVGLDHFALPTDPLALAAREGRLHRNFQGYTTDAAGTLLGLGASAIGSLPQGYVQNITRELPWRAAVSGGSLPIARGVALSDDDRLRAEIIEQLMCSLTVDLASVCARHGQSPERLSPQLAALTDLQSDGLVLVAGDRITVTERGRALVRSVCAVFDVHLAPDAQRHSKAI